MSENMNTTNETATASGSSGLTTAFCSPDLMKRGKTELETLQLNGWGIGDILVGNEGGGDDYILITGQGEELFLCRWSHKEPFNWKEESGNTRLSSREWRLFRSKSIDVCDMEEDFANEREIQWGG